MKTRRVLMFRLAVYLFSPRRIKHWKHSLVYTAPSVLRFIQISRDRNFDNGQCNVQLMEAFFKIMIIVDRWRVTILTVLLAQTIIIERAFNSTIKKGLKRPNCLQCKVILAGGIKQRFCQNNYFARNCWKIHSGFKPVKCVWTFFLHCDKDTLIYLNLTLSQTFCNSFCKYK